jgi:peptidyl-prolyl cis-trans isomerase B (cyclophilin B)
MHPINSKHSLRDDSGILWHIFTVMNHKLITGILGLALCLGVACSQTDKPAPQAETKKTVEPSKVNTNEVALIKTSAGDMVLEFWTDVAPKTVENFKTLARKGFYDGTAFHRIIKGFMIQGGDPLTKDKANEARYGTGDPGYKIKAEFNNRSHQRGVISMARSQDPDSAGSQFFLCHGDASFLDKKYTAFGKLIKGDEVLEKIANTACGRSGGGEASRPLERVEVTSVTIVAADSIK